MLAREAHNAKQPLQRALRRASRRAFLWPHEAADLLERGDSLTQLPGIGPSLNRLLVQWLDKCPENIEPPPIRADFLTLATARSILKEKPDMGIAVKGDLQMHTLWSDGSA